MQVQNNCCPLSQSPKVRIGGTAPNPTCSEKQAQVTCSLRQSSLSNPISIGQIAVGLLTRECENKSLHYKSTDLFCSIIVAIAGRYITHAHSRKRMRRHK